MWHTLDKEEVAERLSTSIEEGLSQGEVLKRLERYGANELAQKKPRPILLRFLDQFKDFMVLILIAAAVISAFVGEVTDTIIILAIVILNAVLGTVQEYRAEESLAALKKMTAPIAKVMPG